MSKKGKWCPVLKTPQYENKIVDIIKNKRN